MLRVCCLGAALTADGCASTAARCPTPGLARIEAQVVADGRLCAVPIDDGVGMLAVSATGTVHSTRAPASPTPSWLHVFDETAFGGQPIDSLTPLTDGGWITTREVYDPNAQHEGMQAYRVYREIWDATGHAAHVVPFRGSLERGRVQRCRLEWPRT